MNVKLIAGMIVVASLFAQGQSQATKTIEKASVAPQELAPGAAIITIRGLCAQQPTDSSACVTSITREQFERMLAAMSFNTQLRNNPVAVRTFAESYTQSLALASSAEKEGIDKDPAFQEFLSIIRIRTLAEAYRRLQHERASQVSAEELEAFYKENAEKFDQVELDRIFIPKSSSKPTKQSSTDFESKAHRIADQIRERAAKGEDMSKLQTEAYQLLGLTSPLTTDMGAIRRGSLPVAVDQAIFSLAQDQVTKTQADAAGFTIYKVRSRHALPLERVKDEISHTIAQRKLGELTEELTSKFKTELSDQYFAVRAASAPMIARKPVAISSK